MYVDVTEDTWTMDPDRVASAVTERTKAILPVHIYGHPADIEAISGCARRAGARGRRTGARRELPRHFCRGDDDRGDVQLLPREEPRRYGDGGAFVTNDADLADRVRRLRDHGRVGKYEHGIVGTNAGWPSSRPPCSAPSSRTCERGRRRGKRRLAL